MARVLLILPVLLFLSPGLQPGQDYPSPREASLDLNGFTELGLVKWHRTMEPVVKEGKKSGRPLLVFTTELPG